MDGGPDQTDGDNDSKLGGLVNAMDVDVARGDGHIEDPKCYPSRAPELAGGSKAVGNNQIPNDAPLLRELEGKPMASAGKCLNTKKKDRGAGLRSMSRANTTPRSTATKYP